MTLVIFIIAFILGGLACLAVAVWSRQQRRQRDLERGLSMVVLRVQPPPLSEDATSEHRETKSVLEENIAKATTLYNLLAATAAKETLKVKYYKQQHLGFENHSSSQPGRSVHRCPPRTGLYRSSSLCQCL